MKFKFILFCTIIFIISCNSNNQNQTKSNDNSYFKYAQFIDLKLNENNIIINSAQHETIFNKSELPLKKVMVVPTAVIAYLDLLDELAEISGVSQPDFIYNSQILEKISQNKIEIIGNFDEILVERILLNKPDLFVSTSSPTLAKFHAQLEREGIKIIYIDEYNELDPLAKAEYIKLFGILFNKENESERIFNEIETNYNSIQSEVNSANLTKPSILVNQMYGDIWYTPCGESFQAKFIADAGGDYLWENLPGNGTKTMNFEQVFEQANQADIWINAGDFPNLQSLLASYKNYEWLQPTQTKQVYNWYKRTTPKGANDYFEMGTARPDLVLKDLVTIFHPEFYPNYELYFYKKLE